MTQSPFAYELGEEIQLIKSKEVGTVEGRAEYSFSLPHYFIRYQASDGRQVEAWWTEDAIQSV